MSRLIPIIYRNIKYPSIETYIHEISCNFYKEKLIVKSPYSLHTECSHGKRAFSSLIVNGFPNIKEAESGNIPLLWFNKGWAKEFYIYLNKMIGKLPPPDVLEIHPPFNNYCGTFEQFLDIFTVFYQEFKTNYPITNIVIENRFGTRYKGGKFLLSKCSDILEFCKVLKNSDMDLKIVLDYPQLLSAEVKNNKKTDSWMGSNPSELIEKIISFNLELKEYNSLIVGLHMWGKLKKENRWIPHAGNFDTFFCNNNDLKCKFLTSVFSTFNDGMARYFVPEVHSGGDDLHSIFNDMKKVGFTFLSENSSKFCSLNFYGITIPVYNIYNRKSGIIERNGWQLKFSFGEKNGKEYIEVWYDHRMTNDRLERIYEDGTYEHLPGAYEKLILNNFDKQKNKS